MPHPRLTRPRLTPLRALTGLPLVLLAAVLAGLGAAGPTAATPALAEGCAAEICQDFALECPSGHEYAALTFTNDEGDDRDVRFRYRWRVDGQEGPWSGWETLAAGESHGLTLCDLPAGQDIQRLEVDGLIPGQPTWPVALAADPPESRCSEVPCGGGLPGGSLALGARCEAPRPFELATVSLENRAAYPVRVSYYWRVAGANLEATAKVDPGAAVSLASCELVGAGRDLEVFAITAVCRMDRSGRRCLGPALPADWAIAGHADSCSATACGPAESAACDRLAPTALVAPSGKAEKARVTVYQAAKKPGKRYPTVRFSSHWLVRRGAEVLSFPACNADFTECGNIGMDGRRIILADFIAPVTDALDCGGEPEDLIGLCVAPATDRRAGYKNFDRVAELSVGNWLVPCEGLVSNVP